MVTSPLSLMLTTWFLQMDWVSLEFGSVTKGRIPLHAARTSPRRTADTTERHEQEERQRARRQPTFNVRAQVVANLPEDEVDVVLSWNGMSGHTGGRVRGPSNGHVLPGQEEDDTTVTGCWVKKTHVVGAGVEQDGGRCLKEGEGRPFRRRPVDVNL